jgi:hypothetical protein
MGTKEICPCVKLECPNHGFCEKCTSRHLRMGSLNYCAFYAVLPDLQAAIAESPDSPAARKLASLVDARLRIYDQLTADHGLSDERQRGLRRAMAEFSDY